MSTSLPRPLRRLAGLGLATAGALACAVPAHAATIDVSARCAFPLVGEQEVSFALVHPDDLHAGDAVPNGSLTDVTFPAAVSGMAAKVELVHPSFLQTETKAPVGAPESTGFLLDGVLPLPRRIDGGMYSFTAEGDYSVTVQDLRLNVRATNAAGTPVTVPPTPNELDQDPDTFSVTCRLEGTPKTTFTVGPAAGEDRTPPTAPSSVRAVDVSGTAATLRWGAATDDVGVDRYHARLTDTATGTTLPAVTTSDLHATFTGLRPGADYTAQVLAIDRAANVSAAGETAFRATPVSTTPKISNYAVSGGFTIWVEPADQPGAAQRACIAVQPAISFTASGFNTVPGGAKLYFQGLWQSKFGIGLPWPMGLLRGSDDHVTYLYDGPRSPDSSVALQLSGQKGGMLYANRQGLASRGRVTVLAWYAVRKRVGWFNAMVPTFLPTKSVSFAFLDKPAGACDANNNQLYLTA